MVLTSLCHLFQCQCVHTTQLRSLFPSWIWHSLQIGFVKSWGWGLDPGGLSNISLNLILVLQSTQDDVSMCETSPMDVKSQDPFNNFDCCPTLNILPWLLDDQMVSCFQFTSLMIWTMYDLFHSMAGDSPSLMVYIISPNKLLFLDFCPHCWTSFFGH